MKNLLHPFILLLLASLFISKVNAQCESGEAEVTIKIHTDNWGSEITWTLSDESGALLSGGPYDDESEIDDIKKVCVTEGTELTFEINDSYGDGICSGSGDGYYQIIAYDFIFFENCDYGDGETVVFTLEPPADIDVQLSAVNFGEYISQEFQLNGTIYNNGLNNITTVDFNWQIEDGAINTQTITGLSISSNQTDVIDHPTAIQFEDSLVNEKVKVWISNPNSSVDENNENDTITQTVEVLDEWVNRRVLIEHFTNASCGPCASQNPILNALLIDGDNPAKIAHIAYHTSWPGNDPMYDFNDDNGEGDSRVSYYGVSGVPDAIVDGNVYQGGPAGITQKVVDDEYTIPAFLKLNLDQQIVDDTIYIDLELIALKDLPSSDMVVHIALTEDLEYESAPGSNGEKSFENVMRTMITGEDGYAIDQMSAYDTENITLKKQFDNIEIDDPKLLIFVQDNSDKDILMAYLNDDDFAPPAIITNVSENVDDFIIDDNIQFAFTDSVRNLDDSEITNPEGLVVFKENNASGADVSCTISINSEKTELTIDPDEWLTEDQTYYIALQPLENADDNGFDVKEYFFTTAVLENPTASFSIEDEATDINVNVEPVITLSDSIRALDDTELTDPSSLIVFAETDENGEAVSFTATIDDNKDEITITPDESLKLSQQYYLGIKSEAENRYNKTIEANSIVFTTSATTAIIDVAEKYRFNAYPNPTSGQLRVDFTLNSLTQVKLGIYNETGQLVYLNNKGVFEAGNHSVDINLSDLPNGFYFIKLQVGSEQVVSKMQLIR
jgi:hypothetical protein